MECELYRTLILQSCFSVEKRNGIDVVAKHACFHRIRTNISCLIDFSVSNFSTKSSFSYIKLVCILFIAERGVRMNELSTYESLFVL